jgi:hypothetical protein
VHENYFPDVSFATLVPFIATEISEAEELTFVSSS